MAYNRTRIPPEVRIKDLFNKYIKPMSNQEVRCAGQQPHQARRILVTRELDELADSYGVPRDQTFPGLRTYLRTLENGGVDYFDRKIVCTCLIDGLHYFLGLVRNRPFDEFQAQYDRQACEDILNGRE